MKTIVLAALLVVPGVARAQEVSWPKNAVWWHFVGKGKPCDTLPSSLGVYLDSLRGQVQVDWVQRDFFPSAVIRRTDDAGTPIDVVALNPDQCNELSRDVFDGGF